MASYQAGPFGILFVLALETEPKALRLLSTHSCPKPDIPMMPRVLL